MASAGRTTSVWALLALNDEQLEKADLVILNLAVARGIPSLAQLEISQYVEVVDGWANQFARWLPQAEQSFNRTPWKWKDDIRFFRIGMLQGFLGHQIGIRYIEEQKNNQAVRYTNPGDLFLNGLIDTKQGTCGNMAALHVAVSRRMGWPVSLACAKCHLLSRFDDGEVIFNIEATSTHPGSFCAEPDEYYIEKFNLPRRAIECGSDLRKLTAREMLGVFMGFRGRHYKDIGYLEAADSDYALSRVLFPHYRSAYVGAMIPLLHRGTKLFDRGEVGHPAELVQAVAPLVSRDMFSSVGTERDPISETVKMPDMVLRPDGVYVIQVPASAVTVG